MYDSITIAKAIINICYENNLKIDRLRLNGLMYCVQVDSICNQKKELFYEDFVLTPIVAIVPSVFKKYRSYLYSNIRRFYPDIKISDMDMELIKRNVILLQDCETSLLCEFIREDDPYKYNYMIYGNKTTMPVCAIIYFSNKNQSKNILLKNILNYCRVHK